PRLPLPQCGHQGVPNGRRHAQSEGGRMSTEQERADFEAWAASIGFCVTGKYAETIDVLCAESAFKAGYQAGRATLQSQDREDAERYRTLVATGHFVPAPRPY